MASLLHALLEDLFMRKLCFFFSSLLLVQFPSFGVDNSIAVSHGTPATYQKKEIKVVDFIYGRQIEFFKNAFFNSGMSARIGNLVLDDEKGTRTGIGSYLSTDGSLFKGSEAIRLSVPFGVVYLDKSRYAEKGKIRNYGGKIQFTYGFELGYTFPLSSVEVFYRFEHMSNAYRYKYNPGLDTHNFGVKMTF